MYHVSYDAGADHLCGDINFSATLIMVSCVGSEAFFWAMVLVWVRVAKSVCISRKMVGATECATECFLLQLESVTRTMPVAVRKLFGLAHLVTWPTTLFVISAI